MSWGTDFNQLSEGDRARSKISDRQSSRRLQHRPKSFKASQPEVQIRLDRLRAAQYGLNVQHRVTSRVRFAARQHHGRMYRDPVDSNQYNINVQLAPRRPEQHLYRRSNSRRVFGRRPRCCSRDVANISIGAGPTRVDRLNRLRQIAVTAYLMPGTQIGNVRQKVDPQLTQAGERRDN